MMDCKDFQEQMVNLFDKDVAPEVRKECEEHLAQCPLCRAEYEAWKDVEQMLMPREQQPAQRRKRTLLRWVSIAASVAVMAVVTGIVVTALSGSTAVAQRQALAVLERAVRSTDSISSYEMEVLARMPQGENFATFDRAADFRRIYVGVLQAEQGKLWRVVADGGRTVVGDGQRQYMWMEGWQHYTANNDVNFLEAFGPYLSPEYLKLWQQSLREDKHKTVEYDETPMTCIIRTTMKYSTQNVEGNGEEMPLNEWGYVEELTFSKQTNLLIGMRRWDTVDGQQTLTLYTGSVHYGVPLRAKTLTALPETDRWIEVGNVPVPDAERLTMLQNETATDAAKRILCAITSGDERLAHEALYLYDFHRLAQSYRQVEATDFSAPVRQDYYCGVLVFYEQQEQQSGKKHRQHIALRRDNPLRIWVADGGL